MAHTNAVKSTILCIFGFKELRLIGNTVVPLSRYLIRNINAAQPHFGVANINAHTTNYYIT